MILIAISVMGQTTTKSILNHRKPGIQKRAETFENEKNKGLISAKNHRINSRIKLLKNSNSTQAVKYRQDSLIYIEYDEDISQWINSSKLYFTYNDGEYMTQSISYDWYANTDQWEPSEKEELNYDDYTTEGEWIVDYELVYTYDSNGKLTQTISSGFEEYTSEWTKFSKDVYNYDVNGNMTQIDSYEWDETLDQWYTFNYKEGFVYDTKANITQIIYSDWDQSTSQWVSYYKDEFHYNTNDNLIEEIYYYYYWNEYTSDWITLYKYEYSYDDNGNPVLELSFGWNEDMSEWYNCDKCETTFDLSYNLSDLIIPRSYEIYPDSYKSKVNMLKNEISYEYIDDIWVETYKATYYYSEYSNVTVIPVISKNQVLIYPNPASEFITIHFGDDYQHLYLDLIDNQGKIVIQEKISNNDQLSIEQLPKGLYFYRLSDNTKVIQSNKILIK